MASYEILLGDCLTRLREMPDESVHVAVTSPPYFNQRDYGCAGQIGLEPTPAEYVAKMVEVFREVRRVLVPSGVAFVNWGDSYCNAGSRNNGTGLDGKRRGGVSDTDGTWEDAAETYRDIRHALKDAGVKHKDLIGVPWECAFALRADGWWLRAAIPWVKRNPMPESCGDRPGTAHEYVFMLSKRPTYFYDAEAVKVAGTGKNPGNKYHSYQDADIYPGRKGNDGIASVGAVMERYRRTSDWFFDSLQDVIDGGEGLLHDEQGNPSALVVNIRPLKEAHFAAFSERFVEPLVRAGTSERGACQKCLEPWRRVVEKVRVPTRPGVGSKVTAMKEAQWANAEAVGWNQPNGIGNRDPQRHCTETRTLGWRPGCDCYGVEDLPEMPEPPGGDDWDHEPTAQEQEAYDRECAAVLEKKKQLLADWDKLPTVPCRVLDPFAGAGTTLLVSVKLGRDATGIELNPDYREIALRRIEKAIRKAPLFFTEGA